MGTGSPGSQVCPGLLPSWWAAGEGGGAPPLLCSPETSLELPPAHPSTDMELVEQAQRRPPKWSEVVPGLCCGAASWDLPAPALALLPATSPLAEGQSRDPTSLGSFPPSPALPQPHLAWPRVLSPAVAMMPIPALHQANPPPIPSHEPSYQHGNGKCL